MPLELIDDVATRVIDQDTGMDQAIYIRLSSANEVVCISATLVVHPPRDSDLGTVYRRPVPALFCDQSDDFIMSYDSSLVLFGPVDP